MGKDAVVILLSCHVPVCQPGLLSAFVVWGVHMALLLTAAFAILPPNVCLPHLLTPALWLIDDVVCLVWGQKSRDILGDTWDGADVSITCLSFSQVSQ